MIAASSRHAILVTDHAWPDLSIERSVIEAAGFDLVAGPAVPASAATITALAREHQPSGILTCWAPVGAEAIAASARLRIVARMGVGLDNIAVEEATRRGVWVTNVPDYCVEEVSDHAVGMTLAWTRGLAFFDREVRDGRWEPARAQLRRLGTLTCGIIGYGRIGRRTAHKLAGFGVRLLAHDPQPGLPDAVVESVSLEQLLRRSDVVVIHAPLTRETHHLINGERLASMRPGSFLVNVSRGPLVDTQALVAALQSGRLSGAGLDVLESEPQIPPALAALPNVILTPHVAFSSDASLAELRQRASEEVVRVLRGDRPLQARNEPTTAP